MYQGEIFSTATRLFRALMTFVAGMLAAAVVLTREDSSPPPSACPEDVLSEATRVRDPEPSEFFEIMDGFEDVDGDTVLLVTRAHADDPTAVAVEEMFDAFLDTYVFVLPDGAEVDRTTKARIAERAGIDFAALATAQREYRLLFDDPGHGHLAALGEALSRVWD